MIGKIRGFAKKNSSVIFGVVAAVGVVGTAALSAQAGYRMAKEDSDDHRDVTLGAVRESWRLYVLPAAAGTVTVAAIFGSKRVDGNRTRAAQSALALSQLGYSQYRDAVVRELGDRKDQAFLAQVADAKVQNSPPPAVIAGSGEILCCELYTMRYFKSDMQTLAKVVNELNAKMLKNDYVTLDDFYWEVGLEMTRSSAAIGWTSDKLLELEFSTILHEDKPCLAFDYNYVKGL